jgi:enoyl-CoA hydratase/carnithine racemase
MVLPPIIRRIGLPKARLLALGSKPLSVTQAFESGLVDEVVDDLEVALAHHARRFSRMDPHAIGIVKTLVSSYFTTSPAGYQASASLSFLELLTSEETLKRLVRFNAGDPPWPEKNAS